MLFNKLIGLSLLVLAGFTEGSSSFMSFQHGTQPIPLDFTTLDPHKGLVLYQDLPYTGGVVDYYSNGEKASYLFYVEGKKHGVQRKWFENGRLSYESTYYQGKRQGMTKTWWYNGNMRTLSFYEKGVPHGIQKQWYVSGPLFKKMNLERGKEKGLQQSWRENGKLYNNYEAKNGRIYGLKRSKLCYELENETIRIGE